MGPNVCGRGKVNAFRKHIITESDNLLLVNGGQDIYLEGVVAWVRQVEAVADGNFSHR